MPDCVGLPVATREGLLTGVGLTFIVTTLGADDIIWGVGANSVTAARGAAIQSSTITDNLGKLTLVAT